MPRSRPSRLSLTADQGLLPFPEAETVAGPDLAPPPPLPAMVVPPTIGPVEGMVDEPVAAPARRILEGSSAGVAQGAVIPNPPAVRFTMACLSSLLAILRRLDNKR
jgi:hypothetical protein